MDDETQRSLMVLGAIIAAVLIIGYATGIMGSGGDRGYPDDYVPACDHPICG